MEAKNLQINPGKMNVMFGCTGTDMVE